MGIQCSDTNGIAIKFPPRFGGKPQLRLYTQRRKRTAQGKRIAVPIGSGGTKTSLFTVAAPPPKRTSNRLGVLSLRCAVDVVECDE